METRSYYVTIKDEDGLIVNVKDDVNRPNNDDCDTVLQEWIHDNYGTRPYEYVEIDSLEVINI